MEDLSYLLEKTDHSRNKEESWGEFSNQLKHVAYVLRSEINETVDDDTNNLLVTTVNYIRMASENIQELQRILKKT
jgi:hypothetical protein